MKNIVSMIIVSVFVVVALPTFALTASSTPNGNPLMPTQAWGLTGFQTKTIRAGESIIDRGGVKFECETWMKNGCSVYVDTPYYINNMQKLASELQTRGWAYAFPIFKGWFNLVN